jgi:hypothetical protein
MRKIILVISLFILFGNKANATDTKALTANSVEQNGPSQCKTPDFVFNITNSCGSTYQVTVNFVDDLNERSIDTFLFR